ncbi:MAG: molybdate ABC transporter substrate-binding protein [Candidatus Levyibacteriota bacterium]
MEQRTPVAAALLAVALAVTLATPLARAAELTVFVPGAVRAVVTPIAEAWAKAHGDTIKWFAGTAGATEKRAAAGEPFDVVITTAKGIDALTATGKVAAGSRADLGSMGVGVAVRNGAPRPDISTPEAFKHSMLSAKSLMYADPALGGQSGIHTAKVFAELGIADQLRPRTVLLPGAPEGLKRVAAGEIEIGIGQISEILAAPGVTLVGPFPPALQQSLTFSAGVSPGAGPAAHGLVAELTGPPARERFRAAGFEIPH